MGYYATLNTPEKLLIALNLESQKGKFSVLNLGRQFYSCNNSIYDAIDRYEKDGLIQVTRLKRDLKIKFTDKGKEALKSFWFIEEFNR